MVASRARRHGLPAVAIALAVLLCPPRTLASEPSVDALAARLPEVFPRATSVAAMEGEPAAAPAYRDGEHAGYLFSTQHVVASAGFSGKPLDILAGVDLDGRITGAVILAHQEPILVIGVTDADLDAFIEQYRGLDIRAPVEVSRRRGGGPNRVDAIVGATISAVVFNDAILRAARAVAASRGILGSAEAGLNFDAYESADWTALVAEGSLARSRIDVDEAEAALRAAGGRLFSAAMPRPPGDATFLDLYAGLATPARVGRNLLGGRLYNRVMAELAQGDQLIFVAGRGRYSFKGTAYVRSGVFDRLQLVQADRTIRFTKADHVRVDALALGGAPDLRELALFKVAAASDFTARDDWRLEILVEGETERGPPAYATFDLSYQLPGRYLRPTRATASDQGVPLWDQIWRDRRVEIAVLAAALGALTLVLVFQDVVARRKRLYQWLRHGFLVFTLVWLGWITGAQLSVVNVLTFADAILTEFHWDFFLLDPLLFILWSYVAVAILFWGRGVFCGWLCPFGALQELITSLAKRLHIPQVQVPFGVHERLWPLKYIAFLALFALFLGNPTMALKGAEIEPFKTAIVLGFDRAWPYVVYALLLLGIAVFVSRAFCRYLCPLGGALAIPARMRMFEWLKRRWQCGNPCHHCAVTCPVQAIHPAGQINPNECVHCLNCQAEYYDDHVCPPLVERRKRRERREAAREAAAQLEGDAT